MVREWKRPVVGHRDWKPLRSMAPLCGIDHSEKLNAERETRKELLAQLVYEHPGCTRDFLAEKLGITKSTLSRYLSELKSRVVAFGAAGPGHSRPFIYPVGQTPKSDPTFKDKVLQIVIEEPGLTANQVSERLGNELSHHGVFLQIEKLEQEESVHRRMSPSSTSHTFWPGPAPDDSVASPLKQIRNYIRDNPNSTLTQIRHHFGCHETTARKHLATLIAQSDIKTVYAGKMECYVINEE